MNSTVQLELSVPAPREPFEVYRGDWTRPGQADARIVECATGAMWIPVYMHNVAEEDIFRPSAWNAFGTADREGADFRACANFGPVYQK